MNFSRQRESILNYLKNTNEHPTADKIYADLKEEMPSLSLATVYRNCKRLVEQGEILQLDTDGKTAHFDADISDHQHFVCKTCGKVYDMFFKLPESLIDKNAPCGFKTDTYKLFFYGVCSDCK